jgi:hypothetical protein
MHVVVSAWCFCAPSSLAVLLLLLHRRLAHQSAILNGGTPAGLPGWTLLKVQVWISAAVCVAAGWALTISSLVEYTLLMNVCIHSLIYITVSPRRLNSLFTDSSLSPIGDHPNPAQLEHRKRLTQTSPSPPKCPTVVRQSLPYPELFPSQLPPDVAQSEPDADNHPQSTMPAPFESQRS